MKTELLSLSVQVRKAVLWWSAAWLGELRLLSASPGNGKEGAAVAEVEKEDVGAQSCPSMSGQALTPSREPGESSPPGVCPWVCVPVCPHARVRPCTRVCVSECQNAHVSVCPYVWVSVHLSVRVSMCPTVRASERPYVRVSLCPSVRVSHTAAWPSWVEPVLVSWREGSISGSSQANVSLQTLV